MSSKSSAKTVSKSTITADYLDTCSEDQLKALMCQGYHLEPEDIMGWEYKGRSLNLAPLVEKLLWKKFKKVFYKDEARGVIRGWNVRIVQDGLDKPWTPQMKKGEPVTFGHFLVVPSKGHYFPTMPTKGVLLDYGLGGNPPLDPTSLMRDPLVAMNEGSADLLLGFTYLQIGPLVPPLPTYFSLERDCPVGHIAEP